jgi:hypothetical protein
MASEQMALEKRDPQELPYKIASLCFFSGQLPIAISELS